jgi:methionyl-tRNA formyltransferase
LRLAESDVARAARRHGIAVLKPATLKDGAVREALARSACDAMVVAAFGMILPRDVLEIPARGCLNIHASLLPRWRGAAPIQRAILAGDPRTGITIMRMDEGLDTGPCLLQRAIAIAPRDTTGSLTDSLAALGAACIVEALASVDTLVARPQETALATYAAKVVKAEALIDWSRPAAQIDRQVRAFDPAPGAETRLDGQPLKIWAAEPASSRGEPGEILAASRDGIVVACGEGSLRLLTVQRAGGKRLDAAAFLLGYPLKPGRKLGLATPAPETKPAA